MPLQRITPPTAEPMSVADAKAWAVVDMDADDNLVKGMIAAARAFAEKTTRRSLITQTWMLTLDAFPGPSLMGVPFGKSFSIPDHAILLERPPVQQILSITYLDLTGTSQTMPSANYVDLTNSGTQRVDDCMRITPVFGQIWPINLPQIGSVQIKYKTGYGDSGTDIPEDMLTWMKMRVATLYQNREECVVGTRITVSELPYVDSLLDESIIPVV